MFYSYNKYAKVVSHYGWILDKDSLKQEHSFKD